MHQTDLEKLGVSQFGTRRKIVRAIAAIERKARHALGGSQAGGSDSGESMMSMNSTTDALPPHVLQRWVSAVGAMARSV